MHTMDKSVQGVQAMSSSNNEVLQVTGDVMTRTVRTTAGFVNGVADVGRGTVDGFQSVGTAIGE